MTERQIPAPFDEMPLRLLRTWLLNGELKESVATIDLALAHIESQAKRIAELEATIKAVQGLMPFVTGGPAFKVMP